MSIGTVTAQEERGTNFKITEQSLEKLKSEGVPNNVLERLQSLKNQEFVDEKDLLNKLKETIGDEQSDKFKSLILEYSKKREEGRPISLEEIVVTGTWAELPRLELPRSVESIGRDFIDNYGVYTVKDAVKRLSGVMPAIEGVYPRRNEDIMIRGQQYSPVMMNGFVMPHKGYLVANTYNINRLDIYKGPGSTLASGANNEGGYGGFLNLTTKKPLNKNLRSTSLSAGGGSYGSWMTMLSGDFNQVIDDNARWLFRMNAEVDISHPFYMPKDGAYSPDRNYSIAPTLKWQPNDHSSVIFELEYQRLDKLAQYGVPLEKQEQLLPYNAFIGNENNNQAAHWAMSQLIGSWDIDSWRLRAGLSFMRLNEKMSYWYIHGRVADIHNNRLDEEACNRDWITISTYFDVAKLLDTGPINHALLLRADFLRDAEDGWYARSLSDDKKTRPFIDLTKLNIVGTPGSNTFLKSTKDYAVLETNRDCIGFALQDEMSIGRVLRISLGTRIDRHTYIPYNSKDWKDPRIMASPRVGIILKVLEKLSIYSAYSHTRTPNWGNVDITGKEMTNNRYSNSYEAGIKSQLTERLIASCALFYNDQKNLPISLTSGNIRYAVLEGRFIAQGIEVSVDGFISDNLLCTFSYTGQKFENEKGEKPRVRNQPKHSFAFYPSYIHTSPGMFKGMQTGLGVRYMGKRDILGPGGMTAEDIMPDYTVLDAFIEYPLTNQSTLRLNINNILNEEYFTSARTAAQVERGDPFNVQLTCVYKF